MIMKDGQLRIYNFCNLMYSVSSISTITKKKKLTNINENIDGKNFISKLQ